MMTSGTIDKEITDHIKSELKKSGIEIKILENTPIRKLSAVIKKLDLYITNDTGTLHVAAGVDANIISLFGPTHGYEWAPIGENKIYIQSPTNEINDITVDNVFEKAGNLIESINYNSEKKDLIPQDHN